MLASTKGAEKHMAHNAWVRHDDDGNDDYPNGCLGECSEGQGG